jgi:gluconolactonase
MKITIRVVTDSIIRYAFDVIMRGGSQFLANKRVFATATSGIPDGIKCDVDGNVYSGCGDGVNVWSSGGSLIGKIVCPGGVANFCFTRKGEMVLLNGNKLWVVTMNKDVQGALLKNLDIEVV